MEFIPSKDNKGIWTLAIITLVLVSIMFLNQYWGPDKKPLFGFWKKNNNTATT